MGDDRTHTYVAIAQFTRLLQFGPSALKMSKRRSSSRSSSSNPLSKTRRTGIDPAWKDDFPWMTPTEDGTGMFCSLCRKHCRRPKKSVVGKAVWTDVPCQSVTRQALVKHSWSESHIDAMKMEAALCSSRTDGGIGMAFQRVISAERKAMIGSLKCMYFLNKREIAHTTNFVPLCELGKSYTYKISSEVEMPTTLRNVSNKRLCRLLLKLLLNLFKSVSMHHLSSLFV